MFSSSKASCSNHLLANSKRSSPMAQCLWMVSRSCCTCCLLLSLFLTKNVLIVLALQSKSSSSLVDLLVAVGLALIKSSFFCCSSEVSDLEWDFLFGLLGSSVIWYLFKKSVKHSFGVIIESLINYTRNCRIVVSKTSLKIPASNFKTSWK